MLKGKRLNFDNCNLVDSVVLLQRKAAKLGKIIVTHKCMSPEFKTCQGAFVD